MQGLFRRAAASLVASVLLMPQVGGLAAAAPHRLPHTVLAAASPPQRIPVKEPVRVKPARSLADAPRPKIVPGTRAHGIRVTGPPMLRPSEIDRAIAAARRAAQSHAAGPPELGARVAPPPAGSRLGGRHTMSLPSDPTASGTGINPWWRYQEQSVPGGGRVMVNVGTGNMLLQYDDMSVPHKGLALAFRRTYNSQTPAVQSTVYMNWQSLYGTGWTNTFDAHLTQSAQYVKSVYDIDGARYDYQNVSTTNVPLYVSLTPGQHAVLASDGGCGTTWTKKNGTTYYFYSPLSSKACPSLGGTVGGYAGRLYQIIGRNHNTYITLNYSWDNGDASATGKISAITAVTESGQTATLAFGDINGRRLLQNIVFADGTTSVSYGYDNLGNLGWVSLPPNNASGIRPQLSYGYTTLGSDSVMWYASSPRYHDACDRGACGTDGGELGFFYSGSSVATSTVNAIQHYGVANPVPADGTGSAIQSGYPTTAFQYLAEYYTTGVTTPTYRDTDGHMTNWVVDGAGRPTQTQECTASASQGQQCTGMWVVTNETWDANNNLTAEVDPRGYESDYAYDANGNTLSVGGPATQTSVGLIRPTRLYQYDGNNNVTAYCDETVTNSATANWGSSDAATLVARCNASSSAWRFQFDNPTYQPYGRLISTMAPDGYRTQYQYDVQKQGGGGVDYGLPTSVSGAAITQYDGSPLTPNQTFWYDSPGNLRCYSKGAGTWVLEYDGLGRQSVLSDPDNGGTDLTAVCGTRYSASYGRTKTTYFPAGTVQTRQSPSQALVGVQSSYDYDLDGNVKSETKFHGCTAVSCAGIPTNKFYDDEGRLVEVVQPHDEGSTQPWITRYLYDIAGGQPISFMGTSLVAHGNLYKTEEISPPAQPFEMKGQGFDALDRPTNVYTLEPGNNTLVRATTTSYDATPTTLGMATSKTDPLGETTRYDYDPMGRAASVQFTGDGGVTPDRAFTYDPSGLPTRIDSVMLGTERTTYDVLGRVTEVDEFGGGTVALTSPATLRYAYYSNGLRKSLSVSSTALTADPLVSYAYRDDSARTKLRFSKGGVTSNFSWTYTGAGRVSTQYDPYTGLAIPRPAPMTSPGPFYGRTEYGYDYGLSLSSVQLPVNGNFTIGRDAEGNAVSYTSTLPFTAPITIAGSLHVTSRGETTSLTVTQANSDGSSTTGSIYSKTASHGCLIDNTTGIDPTCDVRTGATTSPGGSQIPWNCSPNFPNSSYSYDKAGRRIAGRSVQVDGESCNDNGWTGSWTYDAENHTTTATGGSDSYYAYGCTGAIRWNSHGNPALVCGSTLHYDGDVLLFGSNPQGALTFLNVERLGALRSDNSILVDDRDYAGMTVMQHGNAGYSSWDASNTVAHFKTTQTIGAIVPGSDGALPADSVRLPFGYTRSDGFESPFGTVQGTRVSDKDGWTTPDAYAGEVHDPMSQKPFVWNRNNPYMYQDPSGFIIDGDNYNQLIREVFNYGVHCACQRGGIHPVEKGKEGVGLSEVGAELRGETVVGREITIETQSGLRTKIDLVVRDANGTLKFIEAKERTHSWSEP